MNEIDNEQIKVWSEKIRKSNRQAFDELFRYLYPRLVYFAMRYIKEKPAACDIVQDAFLILWQKREEIDPGQSLIAFMFKIVKNRSINWLQKKDNNSEPFDDYAFNVEAEETSPDNSAEELSTLFRTWIEELPERQREAFELSRFEGLDHDEIATVMNVSPKTVNNHIVAALRSLRDRYEHHQQQLKEG